MDTSSDARRTTRTTAVKGGQLRSIAMIVIFDIAAPLVAYSVLRSAGVTAVTALLLSGIFPALGVAIGVIRHRRLDVVGVLVLAGIAVGTILGLISHSARLLLAEGSVPTVVFGVACLGSLWARHPLMFSFAREFTGPDTVKGQEMTRLWQYEGYRRIFRIGDIHLAGPAGHGARHGRAARGRSRLGGWPRCPGGIGGHGLGCGLTTRSR